MSIYPYDIDDDTTILRVDDNVTEISGQNFNQVRDAIFKIEMELGIKPAGTKNSLKEFLQVAHNEDGTIKESALSSVGLVTLPIDNNDVGTNAGILESKLSLTHSTSDLFTQIQSNAGQITNIEDLTQSTQTNLNKHIAGGPASNLRHVLSHIDVNGIPTDGRDTSFIWDGLKNTSGGLRSATHLGQALEQINDELVEHQLASDPVFAHTAAGISVDPSGFSEIPGDVNNVQEAIESLDAIEETRIGIHRAIMHSQGVPQDARSNAITKHDIADSFPDGYLDGYGTTVVSTRQALTYLARTGNTPVNSHTEGDDLIKFLTPDNDTEKYQLDSEFVLVQPGDIARINYGNGIEAMYLVDSVRFTPGVEWSFRINGTNLIDTIDGYTDAYVRIDKPLFDKEVWGIVATAASNAYPDSGSGNLYDAATAPGFLGSVIVSDPRSAVALGIGFDPNQLDSTHYLLYLEMYPNGNPNDKIINIPGIDVTGNQGATPGDYTIESIVQATNNGFRAAGVNARFIAFEYEGNFGITMADSINGVSFAIITGERDGYNIVEGDYENNVVGDVVSPVQDGLGLGANGSDFASPAFDAIFENSTVAIKPTKVLMPRNRRYYVANGSRRDFLRSAPSTENNEIIDGYWLAQLTDRVVIPGITAKTEYTINKDLKDAGLFPGKTITVQPTVGFSNPLYRDADYGRYIIDNIQYIDACPGDPDQTVITVINGVHADPLSDPEGFSSTGSVNLTVALHFDNTSVGFTQTHLAGDVSTDFHRLHEIYTTADSRSFSHERLRMPVQTGGGLDLATANWRVRGASPKLKGFTDANTSLDRYVRMYILNYDSTSGEFDGYIGRRNPSTDEIYDYGPITSGRKDVPVRFYDHSGLDYIEVEYLETATFATSILAPSYVDIQVFPSLELDDEVLLVATCEVNWQPGTNTQIVERVIDRRQVGSISEKEFTQSAKDYITAGNRYAHNNGIIRGLENFGEDDVDSSSVVFGGGLAMINGHVVPVNTGKVRIPELVPNGGSSGSMVNWVICVDEDGNFVAHPLTTTKQHFFAQAGTGGGTAYYIPSLTFDEIYYSRRDLAIVAVVNVTITSVNINSITDARRFINDESNPTVSNVDGYNTTFRTAESLTNWSKWGTVDEVNVVYMEINSTVSLTENRKKLTLRGGTVVVNSGTGFLLYDNVRLDAIDFVYNYTVAADAANLSHSDTGEACVSMYNAAGNIDIESCTFRQTTTGDRPPYTAYYHDDIDTPLIKNVNICKNTYKESSNTYNCSVLFFSSLDYFALSQNRAISDVTIDNNVIDGYQSILFGSTPNFLGMSISGFNITNNYMVNGLISFSMGGSSYLQDSVVIKNNHCYAIATLAMTGTGTGGTLGNTYSIVTENKCAFVHIYNNSQTANIYENMIIARPLPSWWGISSNVAINANGSIHHNSIFSLDSNEWERGILVTRSSDIKDNSISSFTLYGISASVNGPTTNIERNEISKGDSDDITAFIFTSGGSGTVNILDNKFSHMYNDAAETDPVTIIEDADLDILTDRNVNHIKTINVGPANNGVVGSFASDLRMHLLSGTTDDLEEVRAFPNGQAQVRVTAGGTPTFGWSVPLREVLPPGTKIVSVDLDVDIQHDSGVPSWNSCSVNMYFFKIGSNNIDTAGSVNLVGEPSNQTVLTLPNSLTAPVPTSEAQILYFYMTGNHNVGAYPFNAMNINSTVISYTW